ncbi:H-2 class II histocompatibility antigen, A-U alpha chain-like [Megalobrama amblycephala]|uniref:H-2 class II histocompatibility antigen, A-U alpha chain-like n=1 Tax=Megalobrama amblycephala TaxID=75352 RepID=UPI0020143262|nr:H-2 class II histocompatibility antigen, A-U alpha chain-like [Megalobrama amblycephala]
MERFLRIIVICVCVVYINAQSYHEFGLILACGDSDQEDFIVKCDDDQVAHVDFKEQKGIMTLPDFFAGQIELLSLYEDAKKAVSVCRIFLEVFKEAYANSSVPLESPWSSIYPKSDAQLNIKNTLICHVTGFFPPPVRVSWTKNNVNVTDETTVSRYHSNNDGTLNVFSYLSFIPEEGDIYSCSVEHKALQQPQTRTWDVEIKEPSIGPSVFCGVGLALGLLGLATGVFFIAKGINCN